MLFETGKPPNKHTKAMGELIRIAREETGLTQEQLAEKIYRKRLAVSEMENGKVEISAWTVLLLAAALDKPVTYFYPAYILQQISPEQLTPLEQELLMQFRNIWSDHLREIALDQIRVIAQFDPKDLIIEGIDTVIAVDEQEEVIRNFLNRRRRKKDIE
jgi:transcriptional regulator with XRE-family HTH domain